MILDWISKPARLSPPVPANYAVTITYNDTTHYLKKLSASGDTVLEKLLEDYLKVVLGEKTEE